mgnify:CR=1 FL=1
MIIWLIGMSAAGKTAVGKELHSLMKGSYNNAVFMDGDHFRTIMGNDLGHSIEDRRRNADRFCRMSQYLEEQGVHAVCSILSIFQESREWNRNNLKKYFEVFIDVPFEVLVQRDPKKIYERALKGEIKDVVGVDMDFPRPTNPDLVIDNKGDRSPREVAEEIYNTIKSRGMLDV